MKRRSRPSLLPIVIVLVAAAFMIYRSGVFPLARSVSRGRASTARRVPEFPATQTATPPASDADFDVFHGCPMEGDAKRPDVRELNRLKNRYGEPTSIDPNVTLEAILTPGDDRSRWSVKQGAEVVGYVADVKVGGIESTNCHAKAKTERDTHIELSLNPMEGAAKCMIVEITPRWRAIMASRGADWSTSSLRKDFLGRWVKLRGWMLFDAEHEGESENTAPGRPRNWRATAWEVHPIVSIDVINRPR